MGESATGEPATGEPATGEPATGEPGEALAPQAARFSRRRLIRLGALASVTGIAALGAGVELAEHGVLPGKVVLDYVSGGCSVPQPAYAGVRPGRLVSGSFWSRFRNRRVGYVIAYPPPWGAPSDHRAPNSQASPAGAPSRTAQLPGAELPLVLVLHGYGRNAEFAFSDLHLDLALAQAVEEYGAAPFVLAAADGGNGYWHPAPGDDPQGMLVHEFVPLCHRLGAGSPATALGAYGWSMGGYGSLLLGEDYPHLLSAIVAASPAIWTTYSQARGANPEAYSSAT